MPANEPATSFRPRPTVSVITPAYNAAKTLRRACESVNAQTFQDWEHVIVDDGSTDGTHGTIIDSTRLGSRTVIRTTNSGQGAALNTGIRYSTGRYVAFLDADDEFLPLHLEARFNTLEGAPDIDLLWGGIELVSEDEEQAMVPDMERGYGLIHVGECVVQGTIFARRKVCEAIQFREDRHVWYQDFEFVRQAGELFRCARFEQPTYRYYRDSGLSLVDRVKQEWQAKAAVV